MKKLILLVAAVAGLGSLNAQSIGKGAIQLGGTVGFNSTTDKPAQGSNNEETWTDFNVTPRAAYFITDDISVGLGIGFASSTYKADPNANERTTTGLSFTPNVSYYKMFNDQFGLFGSLGIGYTMGSTETKNVANSKTSNTGLNVGVTPGIIFFPADKWAIHAQLTNGLGYSSTSYKANDTDINTVSSFGLNLGLSNVAFGVSYFIGRGE